MKKILILTALLISTSALAQDRSKGISTYDFERDVSKRIGTYCRLTIYGDTIYDGLCNVSRRDRVTIVDTGTDRYKIVREEFDNTQAEIFSPSGDSLGTVFARGSCWTGRNARYCAK